ncbi:DUF4238 domain-containing protein [Streptomyces sp. ME02-6987-2C]|uniref:DUF4238 domain-containing protein n=1 Tax=unclassified Streptomyces TaxID=2593676 RepID=UPI0029B3C568|nr:DUF4238 domain-containing protein [Streptomyces sp. ME02-6987-2C]MDX3371447.1 DUF4238 domain-containing protein [Streptomyces sp. ME02-6987-2C]
MGNNVSRRHHLLPQVWLEGFARDGVLTGRRRAAGRDFPSSVIDATVVSQFYSNPMPEQGQDGQEVEKFLADDVEGPAAAVLQNIRAGRWPLAHGDESALIRLLAHQLARSQAFRKLGKHVEDHLLPLITASEITKHMDEGADQPLSPRDRKRVIEGIMRNPPAMEKLLDPRRDLRQQLRTADQVEQKLVNWQMVLLRADRPLLLLADGGVVVKQMDGSFSPYPPVLPDDAELLAPLAPHLLLILTPRPDRHADQQLTPRKASKANRGALALCHDTIYRQPGHPWPKGATLLPEPPSLLPPSITISLAAEQDTEQPMSHAPIAHQRLAQLVTKLGG